MSFGFRGGGGYGGGRGGFGGGFRGGRGRGGYSGGGAGDDDSSVVGSDDKQQQYDGRRVRQHVERKYFDCGSAIIKALPFSLSCMTESV